MNPKFKIGDEVIIVCDVLPQLNHTQHVITGIELVTFNHPIPNQTLICYSLGFTYEWEGDKNYTYWREACLRPKPKKGDMSFKELMSDLKTNIQERIS